MTRVVSADQVLFNECIESFRRDPDQKFTNNGDCSYSYLLLPFELSTEWDLGICLVQPSRKVILPGPYSAFICEVKNPVWVDPGNSNLFGIALASIFSFVSLKVCKSTRDNFAFRGPDLSASKYQQLALSHPILLGGPGANHVSISESKQELICSELFGLIKMLMEIDYKSYCIVLQSIRLFHLSLSSLRDDFGLAYLLVVSAIESVAQIAIKRNQVRQKVPDEDIWAKKAESDTEYNSLLVEYKTARGKNKYLRERFVCFIKQYAPSEMWMEYVDHPMQHIIDEHIDRDPNIEEKLTLPIGPYEKRLYDLSEEENDRVLSNAYIHRSEFIHSGKQPPHKYIDGYLHRLFQFHTKYDGNSSEEIILPNYSLLGGICKNSIICWMDQIMRNNDSSCP